MGIVDEISRKLEDQVLSQPNFLRTVKRCFEIADADKNGKISPKEAVEFIDKVFDDLSEDLRKSGLYFIKPRRSEVSVMFTIADKNNDYVLNQREFLEFYKQLVKYACVAATQKTFYKYSRSALLGLAAALSLNFGASQFQPFNETNTLLITVPAVILGPILGLALQYLYSKKEMAALQKYLFSSIEDKSDDSTSEQTQSTKKD